MRYHFIGIGGIGMSSLAKILLQNNAKVKGSDLSMSDLLSELKERGATIYNGHKKENISEGDIVVYSSAIKENNPELAEAKAKKLKIIHRSELLKNLIAGHLPLLVTGTHGKTTTTSLLTQVLLDADLDPAYSIGGILNSTKSNANLGTGKYFVVEADESDGSFLNYSGFGGIILNIEKEHFAYWKNIENVKQGYLKFILNMERKDLVVWCNEDKILSQMKPPGESYGFSKEADLMAENIRHEDFQMVFDLVYKKRRYLNVRLNLLGKHNVLNSMAVFLLAKKLGINEEQIFKTFNSFSGVKRRMDKIGEVNKATFFDDYGHHPSEIKATLAGLRTGIKEKRIVCVFQPHRYTRVRELFEEFRKCFSDADQLIVTDIYSAGEDEKEKVDSRFFAEKIKEEKKNAVYVEKEKLVSFLQKFIRPHDVVIFFGAGDIIKLSKEIFSQYQKNPSKLIVALIFGGKGLQHELSKASALSIYENLNSSIYDINLFYVAADGKWFEVDTELDPISKNSEEAVLSKAKNAKASLAKASFLKGSFGYADNENKRLKNKDAIIDKKPNQNQIDEIISFDILKKLTQSDICFPLFFCPWGEYGIIQGLFDTLNLPYIGPSYAACSYLMNKAAVKYIAKENGILTLEFIEIRKLLWQENKEEFLNSILKKFTSPIFIKPCHPGSGIGIKKLETFEKLQETIDEAFNFGDALIVQQGVVAQEIEVAVLGNNYVEAAMPGEVLTGGEFYDFEKKYGKKDFQTIVPANISSEISEIIKKLAVRLYKLIGCSSMARIDFYVVGETIYLNEINPLPAFDKTDLFPKMWIKSGLEYKDLIDRLIIIGLNKN